MQAPTHPPTHPGAVTLTLLPAWHGRVVTVTVDRNRNRTRNRNRNISHKQATSNGQECDLVCCRLGVKDRKLRVRVHDENAAAATIDGLQEARSRSMWEVEREEGRKAAGGKKRGQGEKGGRRASGVSGGKTSEAGRGARRSRDQARARPSGGSGSGKGVGNGLLRLGRGASRLSEDSPTHE